MITLSIELDFFKLSKLTQFDVQDGICLDVRQPIAIHQLKLGVVFFADDADDFIDIQVSNQQTCQDVQSLINLIQAVIEPANDHTTTHRQPLRQDGFEVFDFRLAIDADHVHIDPKTGLKIGIGEQMAHDFINIQLAFFELNHDTARIGIVRFVIGIDDPRQFLIVHQLGDLFDDFVARDLIRQCIDDDKIFLVWIDVISGAHLIATTTGFVHSDEFIFWGDDLSGGRQIRRRDALGKLFDRQIWVL